MSRFLIMFIVLGGFLCLTLGCGSASRIAGSSAHETGWQPWQIIDTESGSIRSVADWLPELAEYDLVYLGEEHYNPHHIDAAIRVLTSVMAGGRRPAIGMEMFGWDGQPALDRYVLDQSVDRDAFVEQVHWKANWGGDFDHYEPLVSLARERHLPLVAMNPPKGLIRNVVKHGLAQVRDTEEWARWGFADEEVVDDAAYRARILDQLRRCHGGGTEEDYRTMYEASMVRDEGMAKSLVAVLERMRRDHVGEFSTVVSYTGGGHIQYQLPVPRRVVRRLSSPVKQVTIYLASFDHTRTSEIEELVRERIADFIWLTPMSASGPVQRCR